MAFRRKKIKDENGEFITKPRKCSICKEKKALMTMHGDYEYGGQTCCDDCYPKIKEEVNKKNNEDEHYTEADYQTWKRL